MIDVFGERCKPQTVGQPVGKIVRLELQPQARRDEMKVETGVTEMRDAIAKLVQRLSAPMMTTMEIAMPMSAPPQNTTVNSEVKPVTNSAGGGDACGFWAADCWSD